MKLNLKRPIVFFDLETTGVDTAKDRIVEISMVKVMPDGEQIVKTRKLNPGIHTVSYTHLTLPTICSV